MPNKTLAELDAERIARDLVPFRGRAVDLSRSVRVYRNLGNRKHGYWSLRQGGLVVAHSNHFMLRDVTATVSVAGRDRVRATKRKSVHAYLVGWVIGSGMGTESTSTNRMPIHITYNPYTDDTFMVRNVTAVPYEFKGAWVVRFQEDRVEGAY